MNANESAPHPYELSARLGAKAHLLGLRLTRLDAREGAGAYEDGPYDISADLTPSYVTPAHLLIYTFDFTVKVMRGRRNALKVRAVYEVAFHVPDEDFTEDEYTAFGSTTAVRVVHPYLRRQINDLTHEFAMDPAVIDLLRVGLPDPIKSVRR